MAPTKRWQCSLPPTTPRLDELPFRFFDLPRELRDIIYGLLIRDVNVPALDKIFKNIFKNNIHFGIANFPCLQAQLINKQFAFEFEKEMHRMNKQELHVSMLQPPAILIAASARKYPLQFELSKIKRISLDLDAVYLFSGNPRFSDRRLQSAGQSMNFILSCLPDVPDLERASVTMGSPTGLFKYFRTMANNGDGPSEAFFRDLFFSKRPNLAVDVRFTLTEKLFSSWKKEDGTLGERCQAWHQDNHPSNKVVFEGKFAPWPKIMDGVSTDTWAWEGLELNLAPSDHGNTFESVLEEIVAMENERPGSVMAKWLTKDR